MAVRPHDDQVGADVATACHDLGGGVPVDNLGFAREPRCPEPVGAARKLEVDAGVERAVVRLEVGRPERELFGRLDDVDDLDRRRQTAWPSLSRDRSRRRCLRRSRWRPKSSVVISFPWRPVLQSPHQRKGAIGLRKQVALTQGMRADPGRAQEMREIRTRAARAPEARPGRASAASARSSETAGSEPVSIDRRGSGIGRGERARSDAEARSSSASVASETGARAAAQRAARAAARDPRSAPRPARSAPRRSAPGRRPPRASDASGTTRPGSRRARRPAPRRPAAAPRGSSVRFRVGRVKRAAARLGRRQSGQRLARAIGRDDRHGELAPERGRERALAAADDTADHDDERSIDGEPRERSREAEVASGFFALARAKLPLGRRVRREKRGHLAPDEGAVGKVEVQDAVEPEVVARLGEARAGTRPPDRAAGPPPAPWPGTPPLPAASPQRKRSLNSMQSITRGSTPEGSRRARAGDRRGRPGCDRRERGRRSGRARRASAPSWKPGCRRRMVGG